MKIKHSIPLFSQSSEAVGGFYIVQLPIDGMGESIDKLGTHKDDFFSFFVLTKGKVAMKCDMVHIEASAASVGIIKPFQIHSAQHITKDAAGYFISVAPFLIPNICADHFQDLKIAKQIQKIYSADKKDLIETVSLLHRSFKNVNSNRIQIANGLLNSLLYRLLNIYDFKRIPLSALQNRPERITTNFKKLILENSFIKSPSFFAKKLNITTSHLNDCVNSTTGKSVTYWLQNAMVIEAQRLLYYTENDVKEIAFRLGFEDHTYFSRLFKKITSETPLAFRKKFRE